jgi:hypothetical protein
MANVQLSGSHHWARRKVRIGGKTFFHRQCIACRRDFVISGSTGGWQAAHIGLLGFDFLDEQTNRKWVSNECPGRQIPHEINDLRMMLKGTNATAAISSN